MCNKLNKFVSSQSAGNQNFQEQRSQKSEFPRTNILDIKISKHKGPGNQIFQESQNFQEKGY